MSPNEISKRDSLKSILNEIIEAKDEGTPVNSLEDDLSLTDDLGLDSLDLAEMTVRLEEMYGVDVFEEDVVDTVEDVLMKLES